MGMIGLVLRIIGLAAVDRATDTRTPAERMRSAICGVCFGVLLLFVGVLVIGWNEKRAVYTAKTIAFARGELVQTDSCVPSVENNGKLVSIQGCGAAPDSAYATVSDSEYLHGMMTRIDGPLTRNKNQQTFAWSRKVFEYVYVEHVEGEGENRTYHYSQEWVQTPPVYSGGRYRNARAFPAGWGGMSSMAPTMCLGENDTTSCTAGMQGAFVLKQSELFQKSFMRKIGVEQPLLLSQSASIMLNAITTSTTKARTCADNSLRTAKSFGSACATPVAGYGSSFGDFMMTWSTRVNTPGYRVSALAEQVVVDGVTTFRAWQNPEFSDCSYCTIGALESGTVSGDMILDDLANSNKVMTWVLRVVGFCVIWFALQLCVAPIAVAPETIPFLGEFFGGIVGGILMCVTSIVALSITMLVVGICWIAMRPLIAVPLLLVFLASIVGVCLLLRKRRKTKAGMGAHQVHEDPDSDDGFSVNQPPAVVASQQVMTTMPPQAMMTMPQQPMAYPPAANYPVAAGYPVATGYPTGNPLPPQQMVQM